MKTNKFLLSIIFLASLSNASDNAQSFMQQQLQGFKQYKKSQEEAFKKYKEAQEKAFKEYKKEIGAIWEEPKLSTKKEWVQYSKDKKTRSEVDFDKNQIVIETIAKDEKEAEKKLQATLAKVVTIDTKTAIEKDPLEQKLAKIKKPENIVSAKIDTKPILAPVVFDKPPTLEKVKKYVYKEVTPKKIKKEPSKKIKNKFIYKVTVDLPKDTTYKRSRFYFKDVKYNSKKQNLPISLVFAIMHTESCFNPKATSHIPAYGLMQIVPRTAGIDSYRYLYKVKKIPSRSYLYNAQNNIKLGSAYLHILYYSYLKKIKNPQSRLYCTIAAYNTGAGNIAWAFTKSYNVQKAAKLINQLTPEEVYNKLLKDLKYDEPKHYLKRVRKRMDIYHKIYKG